MLFRDRDEGVHATGKNTNDKRRGDALSGGEVIVQREVYG
jgi:hypothetical protein